MGSARGRDGLVDTREELNFVPYTEMGYTTSKLTLITKLAKEQPKLKFTSLSHLLNREYLLECFAELKSTRAPGIDQRTVGSYTKGECTEVFDQVLASVKAKTFRPQPVRRVDIPKANGTMRPLGIPTVIDNTIQLACTKILSAVFEPLFLDCSYGFRPKRNAHEALKAVNHMIMQQKVNWVIDADIQGFFDHVDHSWMMRCLEQRISDPNFLWLIRKFLKAGVWRQGTVEPTNQGTPQGGTMSPVLANIYLHYVLDLWLYGKEKPQHTGSIQLVRYADDFVIGVQHHNEAKAILQHIRERFRKFGLRLAEHKTSLKEFGRFAQDNIRKRGQGKPATIDFLGFTHYCSQTRDGRFAVKVKTSRKKLSLASTRQNLWLKTNRNLRTLSVIWKSIAVKLQGHYQYYGVSGNFHSIQRYYRLTVQLLYKWMNRRSQKKTWNWKQFRDYLTTYPLPQPKLTYAIYNTW